MFTNLEIWDGVGFPRKEYRVRWLISDRSIVSGWLPNDYPSFSKLRASILDKYLQLEIENVKNGERFITNEIPIADILEIRFMRMIFSSESGEIILDPQAPHADTVALGLYDGNVTNYIFHNGKLLIEEGK